MSMTKEETTYTVFIDVGGSVDCYSSGGGSGWVPTVLEALIEWVPRAYKPIAWAPEHTTFSSGVKDMETLYAESIAAGRLIEFVDGAYVARGVPVEDKPAQTLGNVAKGEQFASAVATEFLAREQTTERTRPPLSWATPKPFDAHRGFFADWDETSSTNEQTFVAGPFGKFRSPDLIASTHQADPQHQLKG